MNARVGEGLILTVDGMGERDARVRLLCTERGLVHGFVKGGKGKAALLMPFNRVGYEHYRRLEGQLGTFTFDLRVSRAHLLLAPGEVVRGFGAAYLAEMLAALLPEEHPYEGLVARLEKLLEGGFGWREVVAFEMHLLDRVGYGLRLEDVVREGGDDEVAWVSPSSGRAVTRGAAKGWEAKLLALPYSMGGPLCTEREDFERAWALTGCFLERALHGKKLAARARLGEAWRRMMEREERVDAVLAA